MKQRLLKFIKWFFLVWGGFSLIAVVAIAAFAMYWWSGFSNRDKNDSASTHDVRFVLNWCELGDQRIEKVLNSHVSARSFTGDHLDAFAIKISHIELAELTAKADEPTHAWYRGDQLPQILDKAVGFVGSWLHEIPWFPTEAELRSSEIYVFPRSIRYNGVEPSAAELIFVRPSDKMIFYFGGKT